MPTTIMVKTDDIAIDRLPLRNVGGTSVMGRGTGLNPDKARRQFLEERQDIARRFN
jgi:hypothetical protein